MIPIVQTEARPLEGFVENGITTFLGVPYAAPITPERRFRAPQPVEPWAGVGTDFLTVNIRPPSLDGPAPVLVWLHGGGYAVGSANEAVLQSGAFAAGGIVVVTVNYRLGVLGFLQLSDGSPANRALLDQTAALEWVRDNIAAFGGDPSG